jgi:hypothetical protein
MIVVNACPSLTIDGVSRLEAAEFIGLDPIRIAELVSIRRFLEARRELFRGCRVLDFGAGRTGTMPEAPSRTAT